MNNKIKVFSFSGGLTSAMFALECGEEWRADGHSVFYIYMDTGAEDKKTYQFIKNFYNHFKIPLFCIRLVADTPLGTGNNFKVIPVNKLKQDLLGWTELLKKYGTPYMGGAMCTARMKTEVFNNFCDRMFGVGNYDIYLGIRADEPTRYFNKEIVKLLKKEGFEDHLDFAHLYRTLALNDGLDGPYDLWDGMGESEESKKLEKMLREHYGKADVHYMAEFMDECKSDVKDYWSKMPFTLGIDEWCGNCLFCIKKSVTKVAAAIKDRPDEYVEFVNLLESPDVRIPDSRVGKHLVMYRGNNTLRSIYESVKDVSRDEVVSRLRGVDVESGGCSESCEAFSRDDS